MSWPSDTAQRDPYYIDADDWRPPIRSRLDPDDPLAWPRRAGAMAGADFGGDPERALAAENVAIKNLTPAGMAHLRGTRLGADRVAGFFLTGKDHWADPVTIHIDVTLSPLQRRLTLAHELCHLAHSAWSEDACEAFAASFVGRGE